MYTAVLRSVCSYKFLEISLFRKKSNEPGVNDRLGGGAAVQPGACPPVCPHSSVLGTRITFQLLGLDSGI
ncbi:MAG: hypothetical protein LBJ16_03995 [Holosporaceae bacterium]|nr:hypothetical protein [Holosporaceae bacterium]